MFKGTINSGLGLTTFDPTKIDAAAALPIGTIVRAVDDAGVQGEAEFIYLPGLAAVAIGDVVTFDLLPGGQTITRTLAATHVNKGVPVAVAIAAVTAGLFGWFQISGVAIVNVTAAAAAGPAFLTATAGQLNSAAVAGVQLVGARLSSAIGTPAAGKAYLTLDRAAVQSQIT